MLRLVVVAALACSTVSMNITNPAPAGTYAVSTGSYELGGFKCGKQEPTCDIWFPTQLDQGPFPIVTVCRGICAVQNDIAVASAGHWRGSSATASAARPPRLVVGFSVFSAQRTLCRRAGSRTEVWRIANPPGQFLTDEGKKNRGPPARCRSGCLLMVLQF